MPSKADIWMPIYIGDYLADTSHLDAQRHGCYLLWMMHYWRKGPLCNNIDDLVAIGKLRGNDAPSIAQALLEEFFQLNLDGRWHQKRLDLEIAEWQDKSLRAQDKARTAAEARWNKNAPSITPSSASSIAQAMHEQCPLPSPSPIPLPLQQEQKPFPDKPTAFGDGGTPKKSAKKKAESKAQDPRYEPFKDNFFKYYGFALKTTNRPPWDGREGRALATWLKASPDVTLAQWRTILNNRRKSPDVAHGDRLSSWIDKAMGWMPGIADNWGKPIKENTNGRPFDKGRSSQESVIERQAKHAEQGKGDPELDFLDLPYPSSGTNGSAGEDFSSGTLRLHAGTNPEPLSENCQGDKVLAPASRPA